MGTGLTRSVGEADCRFLSLPTSPAGAGCEVEGLVFPRYVACAEPALEPVAPVDALAELGNSGSVLPHTQAGLDDLLAFVAALRAVRLTYGDLDTAVRLLRGPAGATFPPTAAGADGTPAAGEAARRRDREPAPARRALARFVAGDSTAAGAVEEPCQSRRIG